MQLAKTTISPSTPFTHPLHFYWMNKLANKRAPFWKAKLTTNFPMSIYSRIIKFSFTKYLLQNTCELCGQIYKTMGGLNQHIRIFHEKKRFQCKEPDCNKEFNTKVVCCSFRLITSLRLTIIDWLVKKKPRQPSILVKKEK